MTIAEQILRAKTDFDEVFEAGKNAEYDSFWDAFQQNGNRTFYGYAFYGGGQSSWTDEMFKPKYDFKVGNGTAMFTSQQGITKLNCVFDLTEATELGNMFNYMYNLTKIKKIISAESTPYQTTTFSNLPALVEIAFDGAIGTDINFSSSPLNIASIVSVITHLSSVASEKTATFSRKAVNKAFETSSGANDGTTSNSWFKTVEMKPNWNISLV